MLQATVATSDRQDSSITSGIPVYSPTHLTRVTQVFEDGKVNLALVVYLPQSYSAAAEQLDRPSAPDKWVVQVRIGNRDWQSLPQPEPGQPYWFLRVQQIPPGTPIVFRYRDSGGNWKPIQPLHDLETVYETIYVPNLTYEWNYESPGFDHAKVLMETTLEGLLAGYKGGVFAPETLEDLFQLSIAQRLLKTDIPGRIADWGVDEIMVPVCSSIADRSHLDPKFNYLTYNVVELDWQIGRTYDFMRLLDTFHKYGILVVPDLIFAHQVRRPFPGSLDQTSRAWDSEKLMVDLQAYLFRDYGTWMLKLSDPDVRQLLIEKIVAFVIKYRLRMIRIDYIDGLILQYSNRDENFAELFVKDLKAELQRVVPESIALGETFEVAGNPAVQEFIDVFYAPVGFAIVEELYKPPSKMGRPLHPEVDYLAQELGRAAKSPRREAIYAQLHDETWYCQHIVAGRPYVPWAYGGNPAELARRQGMELIQMGLINQDYLLDYVRRTVRNAEALTMFIAKLRYMFVPSVDSLCLGCLDEADNWQVIWEGIPPRYMQQWKQTGLSEARIFQLHDQHRADMIQLRMIFRRYTKVDAVSLQPLVQPQVNHYDQGGSLLSLFRLNPTDLEDSLLILFNFGPRQFHADQSYELSVPDDFEGRWQVLFDGDWIDPKRRLPEEQAQGYAPGTLLETVAGKYSNQAQVLNLSVGAISLVVLKYCGAG